MNWLIFIWNLMFSVLPQGALQEVLAFFLNITSDMQIKVSKSWVNSWHVLRHLKVTIVIVTQMHGLLYVLEMRQQRISVHIGQNMFLAFITVHLPPHLHNSLTSSMYTRFIHLCAFKMKVNVHLLTVFTVQFDRVGWELNCGSSFAGLWKPEVLNLSVSAQHVHVQNWAKRKTDRHGLLDVTL